MVDTTSSSFFLWEETGVPRGNPRLSTECWLFSHGDCARVISRISYKESIPQFATEAPGYLPVCRQQVVFVRLVASCQQIGNGIFTTCNNYVDIIRRVARLFQPVRHSDNITILLRLSFVWITFKGTIPIISWLYWTTWFIGDVIKLVTHLTTWDKSSANSTCWQTTSSCEIFTCVEGRTP